MSFGAVVGGQVASGASDRVAGVVDVTAAAVGLPRARQELHRPLGSRDRGPADAAEAGLDEVDGGQVLPRDAELGLGVPVGVEQLVGGLGSHDPPGRQGARQLRVHPTELAAGVGVQPGDVAEASGSAAATTSSHSGWAPSCR